MEEFTSEDKNILRAFIETPTGQRLLMKLVDQETTLLAEAFSSSASFERQGQIANRVSGIHWVRSLIQDLITIPKTNKK